MSPTHALARMAVVTVLTGAALVAPGHAQDRDQDQGHGAIHVAVRVGESNTVVTVIGKELTWHTGQDPIRLQLPIDEVLCGTPFSGESSGELLIGGRDRDDFVLLRISRADGGASITERRRYRDHTFAALCHDAIGGDLFFVARPSGAIFCAPDHELPEEGEWEPVATIPGAWAHLSAHADGGLRIGMSRNHVRIVRSETGEWSTTSHTEESPAVAVRFRRPLTTTEPIEATVGAEGDLFLEDRSGKTIALGKTHVGQGTYALPADTVLDPAKSYRLRFENGLRTGTSRWWRAIVRIAQAGSAGAGPALLSFEPYNPMACCVGSNLFLAVGSVYSRTTARDLTLYSWSWLVPPGDAPPIQTAPTLPTLLSTAKGVALPLRVEASQDAVFTIPFAIPADPSLAGSMLYFQVCVVDDENGEATLSDVVGVSVSGDPIENVAGDPKALSSYLERFAASEAEIGKILQRFR